MVLVASEPIALGAEIRINYESGNERGTNTYWGTPNNPDQPHESDAWRAARRHPPPPVADAEPLVDGLAQLQRAAEARGGADAAVVGLRVMQELPREDGGAPSLPWEGARGGDARLRVLVPKLARHDLLPGLKDPARLSAQWGVVATHVPGRSGRECRERWLALVQQQRRDGGR